jgi:hypothetical protein
MPRRFLSLIIQIVLLSAWSTVRASTIEECAGNCNIWTYGASLTEFTSTPLRDSVAGTWQGHQGFYFYESLTLQLAPYVYVLAGTYDGTAELGPIVFTGWAQFPDRKVWPEIVTFAYWDPPLDPEHPELSQYHVEVISATPPVLEGLFWHTQAMWQCVKGLTPPMPYSETSDHEPTLGGPEPGTWALMGGGIALLLARRRGVRSK